MAENLIEGPFPAELRELSSEERSAYFRGVQPIWGGGLERERYLSFQGRIVDAPEASGRYRLLGLFRPGSGEMLAAMKTYALRGSYAGQALSVRGVGAVFTPPALRRRGHAARMLRLALGKFAGEGSDCALLFSDIGTAYYEALGFRALESLECAVPARLLPRAGGARPARAGDEPAMSRLFERARRGQRLYALTREGWGLSFQLRRLRELARARNVEEPEWGVVVDAGDSQAAAVVRAGRDALDVLEAAWTTADARERLLGGLRDLLLRLRRDRIRLWPAGELRGVFPAGKRRSAVAMIAPLRALSLPEPGAPADLSLLDHI